ARTASAAAGTSLLACEFTAAASRSTRRVFVIAYQGSPAVFPGMNSCGPNDPRGPLRDGNVQLRCCLSARGSRQQNRCDGPLHRAHAAPEPTLRLLRLLQPNMRHRQVKAGQRRVSFIKEARLFESRTRPGEVAGAIVGHAEAFEL